MGKNPPPGQIMDDRQRLILAWCITEYANATTHLEAMRQVGGRVPYALIGRLATEQRELEMRWLQERGDPLLLESEVVMAQVRTYLTEHLTELDALLEDVRTHE